MEKIMARMRKYPNGKHILVLDYLDHPNKDSPRQATFKDPKGDHGWSQPPK